MSLPFNSQTLPELTEEEVKALSTIIMQNGLMIQQLQLMMEMHKMEQAEEEEKECQRKETVEVEAREKKLKEEEIRTMQSWSKEES